MELAVKTPEEWLQYIAKERTTYNGPNKYKHWMKLYRLAADSIPADELAHNNNAYAKIMVDFAKLQARTSEDDARAIFQAARSNVKHCSLIYVTWAQFELRKGNTKKCKKILEKGKQFCAKPAELLNMALENFKSGGSQLIDEETEEHTFTELINMSLCRADDHVKPKQRTSDSSNESTSSSLGTLSPECTKTTESSEESGELMLSRTANPPRLTNLTAVDELQPMLLNKNVEEKLKSADSVASEGTNIGQPSASEQPSFSFLNSNLNKSQLNLATAAKSAVEIIKKVSSDKNHTTTKPPSNDPRRQVPTPNSTEEEFKIPGIKSSFDSFSRRDLATQSFAEQKCKAVDLTAVKPPGIENPSHTAQRSFDLKTKIPTLTSTASTLSRITAHISIADQQFKVSDLRASNRTEQEEWKIPGLRTTTATKHTTDDVTAFNPTSQMPIDQKFKLLDVTCSVGKNFQTASSCESRKEQDLSMFASTERKGHSLSGSDSSDDYDPLSFKKSLLNIGNKTGLMDFATPQNRKSGQNGAIKKKDDVIPTCFMVKQCKPNRRAKRSVFVSLPQRVPKSESDTNIDSVDGVFAFRQDGKTNNVKNTCSSEGQSKDLDSISKLDLHEDKLVRHDVGSTKEKVFSKLEYSLNSKPDLHEAKSSKLPASEKHNVENDFSKFECNLESNNSNLNKKLSTEPSLSNQLGVKEEVDCIMDCKPSDLLIDVSCDLRSDNKENASNKFDGISKSKPTNMCHKMSTRPSSNVNYDFRSRNVFRELDFIPTSKANDVKTQSMQVSPPFGHYDTVSNKENIFSDYSKLPSDVATMPNRKTMDQLSNDYLSDTPMVHHIDRKIFKYGCGVQVGMPLCSAAIHGVKSTPVVVGSEYQHPNHIQQGCIPGPALTAPKPQPLVSTTSIQKSKTLHQARSVASLGNVDYPEQAPKPATLDYLTASKLNCQNVLYSQCQSQSAIQQGGSKSQAASMRNADSAMDLMIPNKKTSENDNTNTAISSFKPVTHLTSATGKVLQVETSRQSGPPIDGISAGRCVASGQESVQESGIPQSNGSSSGLHSGLMKHISLVSGQIAGNIPGITVNGKAYSKLNMIGRGGSSEVYTVLDCEYNQYALKYVDLKHADATVVESYVNEITLLKRLQGHESIIKLYDWEMDEANKVIKIVLERGSTDLAGYLKKNPDKITVDFIKMCWKKMLDAVDVVHKAGIIHTDLKPANFLLVEWNLKLIDFGIANAIQGDVTSFYRDSTIGTLSYMSPEALKDVSQSFDQNNQRKPMMKIGRPSDVWSLGCILFLMVYDKTPFQDIKNNFQKWRCIIDPTYEIKFPWIENQDLLDSMKGCLRRNPSERYTIAQLKCHPFLMGRASANDVDNVLNCLMQMQDIRSPRTLRSFAQNLVGHLSSGSSLSLASVKLGDSPKILARRCSIIAGGGLAVIGRLKVHLHDAISCMRLASWSM